MATTKKSQHEWIQKSTEFEGAPTPTLYQNGTTWSPFKYVYIIYVYIMQQNSVQFQIYQLATF